MPTVIQSILKHANGVSPVVSDTDVVGGLHTVATLAERDAISAGSKKAGMVVSVASTKKLYILGQDLETWSLVQTTPSDNGVLLTSDVQIVIGAAGTTAQRAARTVGAADGFVYLNLTTGFLDIKTGSTWTQVPISQGPQGDKGLKGDKGDKGDKGADGNDGSPGLVPKGTWSPTNATYLSGDLVYLNGTTYICLVDTPNITKGKNPETATSFWAVFAAKGARGLNPRGKLKINTQYVVDDLASFNGSAYLCIANNIIGSVLPSALPTTSWVLLVAKGDAGDATTQVYIKHKSNHSKDATGADADPLSPDDIGALSAVKANQTLAGALSITGNLKASCIFTSLTAAGAASAYRAGQIILTTNNDTLYYATASSWKELAKASTVVPTAQAVGALPITGGTLTGSLTGTSLTLSGNLTVSGVTKFIPILTTAQMDTSGANTAGTIKATALGDGGLVFCSNNDQLYYVANKKFVQLATGTPLPITGGTLTGDLTIGTGANPANLVVNGVVTTKSLTVGSTLNNANLLVNGNLDVTGVITAPSSITRQSLPALASSPVTSLRYVQEDGKVYYQNDDVWSPLTREGVVNVQRYTSTSRLPLAWSGVWDSGAAYEVGSVVSVVSGGRTSYWWAKNVQLSSGSNSIPSDTNTKWVLISDSVDGINLTTKNDGDWLATMNYVVGEIVRYNGFHWLSVVLNPGASNNPSPTGSAGWVPLATNKVGVLLDATLAFVTNVGLMVYDPVGKQWRGVLDDSSDIKAQPHNVLNPSSIKGTIAYRGATDTLMYSDGDQWIDILSRDVTVRAYHDPQIFPAWHKGLFDPYTATTVGYKRNDFVVDPNGTLVYRASVDITAPTAPANNAQWQLHYDGTDSHDGTGFVRLINNVDWQAGVAYTAGAVVKSGNVYYMATDNITAQTWNVNPGLEKTNVHPYDQNPSGAVWPWKRLAGTSSGMEKFGTMAVSAYGSMLFYLSTDGWKLVGGKAPYRIESYASNVTDNTSSTSYHTISAVVLTKDVVFGSPDTSAPYYCSDSVATYFADNVITGDDIDFQVVIRQQGNPDSSYALGSFVFTSGSRTAKLELNGTDYRNTAKAGDVLEIRSHLSHGGLSKVAFTITGFSDSVDFNLFNF